MAAAISRVNVETILPPKRNYMVLTLRDLLEARQHSHVQLAHLPNVASRAFRPPLTALCRSAPLGRPAGTVHGHGTVG